jgi:sec-independent protein translocase protein TatC
MGFDFFEDKTFTQEIKKRGIRLIIIFIFFAIIISILSTDIINFIRTLIPQTVEIVAFSPTDVFSSVVGIIIWISFGLTIPFLIYEIISFASPGLYPHEKKLLLKTIPISIVLFVVGAGFGIWVISSLGLNFLADLTISYGVKNIWGFSQLIDTFIFAGLAFGICFQTPILIVFLTRRGLIKIEQLKAARKYVIVGILIISAVATPSPDFVSQLTLAIPIYALYELTLLYLQLRKKKA